MNFFERQEQARCNSQLLLGLFLVALVLVVAALDLSAVILWYFLQLFIDRPLRHPPHWLHYLVTFGAAGTILAVSLHKTLDLYRGGGLAVARMMGARQVVPMTAPPLEKRLANIVEEMAIAAGTRVPLVFVMDQHGGINAFAAGFDGKLCAIIVTRGALERLNRNELQGVIGHEFSHIVNGDMAFNLQLVGVLAGLSFIGAAGAFLLRVGPRTMEAGDVRVAALATMSGIALFIAGYSGLFASQLIKAKIAREREYGADAASVQFTRNPEGLAGALDQVRQGHSTVLHLHTEDVSHLFFAEAMYLNDERWLSTHPPLEERIDRLAPGFRESEYRNRRVDPLAEMARASAPVRIEGGSRLPVTPGDVVALVGGFGDREVDAAAVLLAALPAEARAALQSRDGAAALVLALAMSPRDEVMERELAAIAADGHAPWSERSRKLLAVTRALPVSLHLPAADIALAEIVRQSPEFRSAVAGALQAIIGADDEVSVYRYACLNLMRAQLIPGVRRAGRETLASLREDVALTLSLVAYAGCADKADFDRAFTAGITEMELGATPPAQRERCDAQALTAALERLRNLAPLPKARLIRGYFAAVTSDGAIDPVEAALMRMMGAVLDCPIPPLI
jgi:Zn-dependent protease with chaperone function